jgi:hypothetical protein
MPNTQTSDKNADETAQRFCALREEFEAGQLRGEEPRSTYWGDELLCPLPLVEPFSSPAVREEKQLSNLE